MLLEGTSAPARASTRIPRVTAGPRIEPLRTDVIVYAGAAACAAGLAAASGLVPHQRWGYLATVGYAVAALLASIQLVVAGARIRGHGPPAARWRVWWHRGGASHATGTAGRTLLVALTGLAVAIVPMLLLATGRVAGGAGWAQSEVRVVEAAGQRLLDTGIPYLDRTAIAALPVDDRLAAYTPYQPGMALFGVPRALDASSAWWSDARVWFAVVALAALAAAVWRLPGDARVRVLQAAAAVPPVALAVAVGGDDVPVLALCLLGLALAARRPGAAGLAIGAAGALKLIAWPVAVVLAAYLLATDRRAAGRYAVGAAGVPALALLPALLVDASAVAEHVLLFPLGAGLVSSPAQAPLPGYLVATYLPGGRLLAIGLLLVAVAAVALRLRHRPPRTVAEAAAISGYGLLAAMMLMPATRFGYVLYPLAFLVWAHSASRLRS